MLFLVILFVASVLALFFAGPIKVLGAVAILLAIIIAAWKGFDIADAAAHHYLGSDSGLLPTRQQLTQMLHTASAGHRHFTCADVRSNSSLYSLCQSRHH